MSRQTKSFVLVFAMIAGSLANAELTLRIVDNHNGTFGIESTTPYAGVEDDKLFAATSSPRFPFGGAIQPGAPAETEIIVGSLVFQLGLMPPDEYGIWGVIGDSAGVPVPPGTYIDGIQCGLRATVKLYEITSDMASATLLHAKTLSGAPDSNSIGPPNLSMEGAFTYQHPLGNVAEAWTGYGSGYFSKGSHVHHGVKSQQDSWSGVGYETFGPDGIYQQIESIESGRIYQVSAWFSLDSQYYGMWGGAWITCRVGVDPNGGTSPDAVTNWMSDSDDGSATCKKTSTFFLANGAPATIFIEVTGRGSSFSDCPFPWAPCSEPWDAQCHIDDVNMSVVEIGEASTIEATLPFPANGAPETQVAITLVDACGIPIEGIPASEMIVHCTGTGNIIDGPHNATDASGWTTLRIASTVAEVKTVTVTVLGTLLADTATLDFSEVYLGPVWYVDVNNLGYANGSPEYPFRAVSDAILGAKDGDMIIVRPGTYYDNINYSGKELTIRSTKPQDPAIVNSTIIDANGLKYAVSFTNYNSRRSVLAGFTITGASSAGVSCRGFLSIRHNTIKGNDATGITCEGYVTIEENVITHNGEHGIFCEDYVTIESNVIAGNGGDGIYLRGDYVTIQNNVITENGESGISCGWGHPTIQGNFVAENHGRGIENCEGLIKDCLIVNNSTAYYTDGGGGLYECDGLILNCTIAFNHAKDTGGGLSGCDATIKNCIIWGNTSGSDGAQLYDSSVPTYSCIQDWTGGGLGNISDDPLFAASDHNDFHVLSEAGRWGPSSGDWVTDAGTSPCIDAGDPLSRIGVELNPNGARINMGCYGGTVEASKSPSGVIQPVCIEYPALDFNKDCKFDFLDFGEICAKWLECNLDPPELCFE